MGWFLLSYFIQCLFHLLLFHFPSCTSSLLPLCSHDDSIALLQFKKSFALNTSAEHWFGCSSYSSKTASWKNGTNCCQWDGVTCDTMSGHVTGLDLSCSMLQGEFHPNSTIFKLTHLQQLNLAFNNFSGSSISSGIGDLVNLTHLNLSNSAIGGDVPSTISHLSKLESLVLSNYYSFGSIRLDPSTWKKLILNATNLRELLLDGVDMSSIKESSFSLLVNLSSSLMSLSLEDNKLQGNFPSNVLCLPNLQVLCLAFNHKLRGQLPKSNWSTPLRFLDLYFTAFSGAIPNSIGHLKSLIGLSLSRCKFDGLIPLSLCNHTQLIFLDLAFNNLNGMIPQCLGTPSLSVLDLQMNNLHGSIPRNISKVNVFQTIKLNGNRLEGPLPKSLADCLKLEVLDLGDNNMEDIFPSWLETLQELQVLSLRANKFHGIITCDSTMHPFPKLRIFDVSNNNLSGHLPASCIKNFQGMMNVNEGQAGLKYMKSNNNLYSDSIVIIMKGQYMELVRILTTFKTIDLSNNLFEGEIPKVIAELNSLKGLNLSHNGITGTIPQSLSNLRSLEWLDLSWNQLTGEIPMALTNLNFLSFLNLSQNQFEGTIPRGGQFNTFDNDSYEGNQMLCGLPLSKSCNKDEELPLRSTLHHEEESRFGWKAAAMGYACGVVVGMFLGYTVFLTGKPQWVVSLVEGTPNKRVKRTKNRANANRRVKN